MAAGQLRAGADPRANLKLASGLIEEAARREVALLVLPEATMVSFAGPITRLAEPLDGHFAEGVRRAARTAGLHVVVGMFEPAADGRVHNTLLLTGPSVEAHYRKVHVFDAFGTRESETVAPGGDYVTAQIGDVTVGLATCFDVRFPDQFTSLARAGAEVIALPASWASGPGKADQWTLLARARAADAQAWLVACDQAGESDMDAGPLGIGLSLVAGPTGDVAAQLDERPGLLVHDIDLDEVERTRRLVPQLCDSALQQVD